MTRIFLATSFSGKVNYDTGEVLPEFRGFIEGVLAELRKQADTEVFCAIEHEGWKITDEPPEVGVQKDLAAIDKADVLLALVDETPSAGVQFEIGYAVAKGKRVVLATEAQTKLAYFNDGVVGMGGAELVVYGAAEDIAAQIK